MKKAAFRIVLSFILVVLLLVPAAALAAETDGAGNQYISDNGLSGGSVENDLYGAGNTLVIDNANIGESAVLAGRDVSVLGSSIGGSLRAAAYNVNATDTKVDVNATVAGYSVTLGSGFSAKGVYAAAATVTFSGEASTVYVSAQSVFLNGVVNGDAHIYAESVTIGSNAVVTGTLEISAGSEPVVPAGAKIGNLSFTLVENETESSPATQAASKVLPLVKRVRNQFLQLPGRLVLAVLLFFVIGGALQKSGQMLLKRPVAMLVTGFVALIATPLAVLFLMLTVIGIPAALLVLCLYVLVLCFALVFTACAVGRILFKSMHPLLACVIGAAIFTAAAILPLIGWLVRVACMIFALGYFLQTLYLSWNKSTPAPEAAQPACDTLPDAAKPESDEAL